MCNTIGELKIIQARPDGYIKARVGRQSCYVPPSSKIARLVCKLDGKTVEVETVKGMVVKLTYNGGQDG